MEELEKKQQTQEKKKKSKTRMLLVLLFVIILGVYNYVSLRGNYLELLELGANYTDAFFTNLQYKYAIMAVNFVILYIIIYFTNRGIKKGLKVFFDEEKKEMPKLLNKSLALVISAIISIVMANVLLQKIILLTSNASFGMTDPIFNMDISYYMFIKPVLEIFILYAIFLILGLSIYMTLYYVIVFNKYFDGIDRETLKKSLLMKKLTKNVILIAIGIALITFVNTQNVVFQNMLTVNDTVDLVGAGFIEATIKLWGYRIFAIVIIFGVCKAVQYFKQGNTKKILIWLGTIPAYLVILFVIMFAFDLIFVNSNELDREKEYIADNIENTKNAYNINIQETNLDYSGTVTLEETQQNENVVNNIAIMNKDTVLKTLEDNQTETGYYTYRNANIAKYSINGQDRLVYLAPREIASGDRTYNNKTYEYTHGYGEIIASATTTTETGNVNYVQKEITGEDNKINVTQPRIYFGTQTNETIATNTKNKKEYDYTDKNGNEHEFSYDGKAGLTLNFMDRLILGIRKGDLNLAFSGSITKDSKILINRNIIERAKKAMPYFIYDNNPYTVIDKNGNIIWVLDAYTVSGAYPYSTYTTIENEGKKEKINYIRNSVKVLINSYDGTMEFYITDRTDPIAMAYRNVYPTLFQDLDKQIPTDISEHFIYPEFLYNIQAKMLEVYHNVKPDVLYRSDDIWDIANYNTTQSTKSTGTQLEPYYTMVKTPDSGIARLGLVQAYTPQEKQNLISYLVGSYENGNCTLKLYKFSSDSNIVGPMQLDKQIEEDETISAELESINVTGTKTTKQMIIVPIENTILYVEPIYQVMLNESDIPALKKVIVASGNKVAIGDDLRQALEKLLSRYAVDIEVENTEDIDGLIDAIIKANNNLTQSNSNNDWEMMGSDINKLQELITSLETLKEEEEKKQKELNRNTNQNNVSTNMVNETNNSTVNEVITNGTNTIQ